jgi:muramidase (phage lysozyme)
MNVPCSKRKEIVLNLRDRKIALLEASLSTTKYTSNNTWSLLVHGATRRITLAHHDQELVEIYSRGNNNIAIVISFV